MHRLAALIPRKDRWRWGRAERGLLLVEKNTPASDTRAHSNYADKLGREKGEEEGKRELTRYIPRASCCWKGKKKRALHRPSPSPSPSPRVSLTFAIFFGLSTLCKITSSLPLFLNERASVMLSTTTPSLIGQNGWFMCRPPCTWGKRGRRKGGGGGKKRREKRVLVLPYLIHHHLLAPLFTTGTKRSQGFYGDPDAAHEKFVEKLFETARRRHHTIHIPPSFDSVSFSRTLCYQGPCIKEMSCCCWLLFALLFLVGWVSSFFFFFFFSLPSLFSGERRVGVWNWDIYWDIYVRWRDVRCSGGY